MEIENPTLEEIAMKLFGVDKPTAIRWLEQKEILKYIKYLLENQYSDAVWQNGIVETIIRTQKELGKFKLICR